MSKDEQREKLRQALSAYNGPVTRCRPGAARGKALKLRPQAANKGLPKSPKPRPLDVKLEAEIIARDKSARWLSRHRDDRPVIDPKEARRRKRMARARQHRIAERNAALLKGGT